jgi:hypothetical protein
MSSVVSGFSVINANAFSRPDGRTAEEYREEVQGHISRYAKFLNDHLRWEYVYWHIGRLRPALVNPTDRAFEEVQLEIYLSGQVAALYPGRLPRPASSKPARPRPFGTRQSLMSLPENSFVTRNSVIPPPANLVPESAPAPKIDNSASARVTYPPVLLRPHASVTLDDIILFAKEPPGAVVPGTWEASGTNAQGRVSGDFTVRVADTRLPVRELLAELFPDAGSDAG